eukprot:CAMPEP_0198693690 /NCGR_PEP_ID=MMETSP1468-20131203/255406_1 /TAXON_ID=1461545 /ORGANISM="Mantoniella sp, Strain CCMP1436" /LENGTH=116 /DNA_ID=CAMNT_0044448491 /DNA_START=24 /DNA_END=371 /DNA_ORIENTATION=-
MTGAWVGDRKLGAVGVQISGGVSTHGLAFNHDPDLSMFDHIVPCGLHGRAVTSLARELAERERDGDEGGEGDRQRQRQRQRDNHEGGGEGSGGSGSGRGVGNGGSTGSGSGSGRSG